MQCLQCGYILDPFDRSCPKCANLARTQAINPAMLPSSTTGPGPSAPEQTSIVCPGCQYPAPLGAPACTHCGLPFGSSSLQQPGTEVTQKDRRFVLLMGASIGLLLIISLTAGAFFSNSRKGNGSNILLLQTAADPHSASVAAAAVDAQQINSRLLLASATTGGDLEVSLAWNSLSDFDLEVKDPSGELITAEHPTSASGGVQDVDANPTLVTEEGRRRASLGQSPGPENVMPLPDLLVDLDKKLNLPGDFANLLTTSGTNGQAPPRFTHSPVEHIYFTHAPGGVYTVYAHCYSWREPDRAPLPFTIQVRTHGQIFYQTSGVLGPQSYITDNTTPTQVCQFMVR